MNLCDLTLPSPAQNLALDELLLEMAEERSCGEVLRFWEPDLYFVVLGYANRAPNEARLDYCQTQGIPVLRRTTGGGTVLQGPGVLNYSLILHFEASGPLRSITSTNQFIMERHREALSALLGTKVEIQGYTDLALNGRKFAGNAQRRKKDFLIFHGSLLLDLDIAMIEKTLPMPSHQPEYRSGRSHSDFVMNVGLSPAAVKNALRQAWAAQESLIDIPQERVERLATEKYGSPDWNLKF